MFPILCQQIDEIVCVIENSVFNQQLYIYLSIYLVSNLLKLMLLLKLLNVGKF